MADSGDIYVGVHADTEPFDPELEAGLRKASRDAERLLDEVGETWGETLADATSEELGKHGKDFSSAIEDGVRKNKINIDGEWFTIDSRGRLHDSAGRFARQVGEQMVQEVQEAFTRATSGGGSGGIFNRIGTGIADAIGAGFNISGRSPLIAALIPALGAIVTLAAGAIQAINGLAAALTTLPALLTAIGLQVAVVAIAFDGVGEAMTKAFDAKNAKELNEALKDLTPSAREFVKSMLPVKKMWEDLKNIIQENFFAGMGDSVSTMLAGLIELTRGPFGTLARQMGEFFAQLANFFNSPIFREFVTKVFPATGRWLQSFGPVFVNLLEALTRMATVAIPFLEKLGGLLNRVITKITNRLNAAIEDGTFEAWLERMFVTLETLASVFGSLVGFVMEFIGAVDAAGGNKALATIGEFFSRLGFFFSSPVGIKALEGMINAAIVLTEAFGGLIIIVSTLFALVQVAFDAIGAFLSWLWNTALPALGEFFASIPQALEDLWLIIQMWFADLIQGFIETVRAIGEWFIGLWDGIVQGWNMFLDWVKGIPGRILNAIATLARQLWEAGIEAARQLIQGLINGIKMGIVDVLGSVVGLSDQIKSKMRESLGISSPSKVTYGYGQDVVAGFEKGIHDSLGGLRDTVGTLAGAITSPDVSMTTPSLDPMSLSAQQTINLNMGGLTFDGVPNDAQATSAGKAVAAGAQSQLQQRDTRLAVRMI